MHSSDNGASDDATIVAAESLLRRIPNAASPDFVVIDPVDGTRRPSSSVFKTNDEDGISIYLDSGLADVGLAADALLRAPNNAVCAVQAGQVRMNGLGVVRDPWPTGADDPTHPRHAAHGLITFAPGTGTKRRRRLARELASKATIVLDLSA